MKEILNDALENNIKNDSGAIIATDGDSVIASLRNKYTLNPNFWVSDIKDLKLKRLSVKNKLTKFFANFGMQVKINECILNKQSFNYIVKLTLDDKNYIINVTKEFLHETTYTFVDDYSIYSVLLSKPDFEIGNIVIYHCLKLNSSDKWYEILYPSNEIKIMDPDGWNRQNYYYSYFEEQITYNEFIKRVMYSTCSF
jgi:hypothetical protein